MQRVFVSQEYIEKITISLILTGTWRGRYNSSTRYSGDDNTIIPSLQPTATSVWSGPSGRGYQNSILRLKAFWTRHFTQYDTLNDYDIFKCICTCNC